MAYLNSKDGEKLIKKLNILLTLIILVGVVLTTCVLFINDTSTFINQTLDLFIYVLIILYFVVFYKKAHSNFLRYLYVFYVAVMAYNGLAYKAISYHFGYALITTSISTAFISSRLHKFNQNQWILLAGFCLLLFGTIQGVNSIPSELISSYNSQQAWIYYFSFLNPIIQYVCISASYLFRSYSHKEAAVVASKEEEIL